MNFGRQVIIEIGQPGEEGRRFTDLRIGGKVEKAIGGGPNIASVTIVNPARDSVALAQEPGAMVRILAGYETPRLLFVGDINRGGVIAEHHGTDRVMTIEAQDGGRRLREAHIEASFAEELSGEQIFGILADAMNLPLGAVILPGGARWPRGWSFAGHARDALDELADSLGVRWSVQDGALQVLPDGEDTGELGLLISIETGNLIGSPKPIDDGLEVTALLDGRLRPGRRFELQSGEFNGIYRIGELTHIFDSGFQSDFYSVLVARPL